jgi:hypothetical protein
MLACGYYIETLLMRGRTAERMTNEEGPWDVGIDEKRCFTRERLP